MLLPGDTEVTSGESVTLGCVVAELGGECRWEKDGLPVGHFDDKYIWSERLDGDCSLTILDTSADYDAGAWVCQVSASDIEMGDSLVSPPAQLTVIHPPTQVYLQHTVSGKIFSPDQLVVLQEDEIIDLTCVSVGGNPSSDLSWQSDIKVISDSSSASTNGRQVFNAADQSQTRSEEVRVRLDSGEWVTSSRFLSQVSRPWHQTSITCEVQHRSLVEPLKVGVTLFVLHRPFISDIILISEKDDNVIKVGDDVILECQVESNPQDVSIYWFKSDQPDKTLSRNSQLRIKSVKPEDVGNYICVAQNERGPTQKEHFLDFQFQAKIKSISPSEKALTVKLDELLELRCDVVGNPIPEVWWVKRDMELGLELDIGHGSVLLLDNVNYKDTGKVDMTPRVNYTYFLDL